MAYDYQGAIKAGANPNDVINYLAKQNNYDAQGALKAGANPQDVLKYLANKEPGSTEKPKTTANAYSDVPVLGQVSNFGIGIGSALGKAALGIPEAALNITTGLGKLVGADTTYSEKYANAVKDFKNQIYDKPFEKSLDTYSGQAGNVVGSVLPYLAGSGEVNAATKGLSTLPRIAARTVPDLLISGAQSGADPKTVLGTGLASATANTLLPGSGVLAEGLLPRVGRFGAEVAPGYVSDVAAGLSGQRGEDRTGASAFIPGQGTALATGLALGVRGSSALKEALNPSEQQIESTVLKKFTKGVRPLLPGKSTPATQAAYKEDVINAVKTIQENKPNLNFNDETGGFIKGENPKSLQQLSDAIDQTKKSVFAKYDALAKKAGDAGVSVQTSPIANELDAVINNKALSLTNPKAVEYAQNFKDRLLASGPLNAITAQEVIQNFNKSLEAFYRNPSYDNASQASIDAMIANRMRKSLDEGITGLTGTQYQELKNKYGSLKAIEKDVVKAALRDSRKNVKGLIDFTDIFSGGQVVNGILSLNPSQVASGLTQKAIAETYKYLNNPNRAIEKMFNIAEGLPQPLIPPNSFQTTSETKPKNNGPINSIKGNQSDSLYKNQPSDITNPIKNPTNTIKGTVPPKDGKSTGGLPKKKK